VQAGTIALDASELRRTGAAMLALAAILPALPGHPGLPCPLRTLTGIPCPLCGMTTSVEATVHLDLRAALAANPAGLLAVAAALVLLVVRPARVRIPALVPYAALAAMWVFELYRFGVF
jgi:hypothetical protein